ncbi:MAG: hypothetical protein ACREKH_14415 [Candidatus Rokuibacteriota bacterium]
MQEKVRRELDVIKVRAGLAGRASAGTMQNMRFGWLTLAVAVYISLDVANPLMPGALTFGIEDSVEIRLAERFRSHHNVVSIPATPPSERAGQIDRQTFVSLVRAADIPRTSPSHIRRARSSLSAPASSLQDH